MKNRCIATGIHAEIPGWLQNLMWFLWESADMSEGSGFQSFRLSGEDEMQRIEHAQKQPPYQKVICIPSEGKTVCERVIILEERNYLIMMLESEYLRRP